MTTEDKLKWKELLHEQLELYEEKNNPAADLNSINGAILGNQARQDSLFSGYQDIRFEFVTPEHYAEYFIGEEDVYGLASISGKTVFQRLGSVVQLQDLVGRLQEFILLKGLSMDDSIQHELYTFLLKPLIHSWPDRLVIIPDGIIGYIPFEMLKDERDQLLIEKTICAYTFEYLGFQKLKSDRDQQLEIFCLAPDYPKKEGQEKELVRGSIYHLPYARMEVDSIQHLFGTRARASQSADKEEWEKEITECRVFHYAGHAIVDGDQSFLALTMQGDDHQQIKAQEISLMHHPLELAVLSACETGLGKLDQGEGIRSLGRSFMESGTKATVISLWTVNDRSTAAIMTGFYKQLRNGLAKDQALRQAKLEYLRNASPRNAHPYFWAAFIPAGDMSPLVF
jgi:CHAT domain-containing protein